MKRDPELTVSDIFNAAKWRDVKRALKYYYPEDKNDYTSAFEKLKNLPTITFKKGKREYFHVMVGGWAYFPESLWRIKNREKPGEFDDDYWYHASLKKEGDPQKWGMSFMHWSPAVSLIVSKDTLRHYTFAEIAAHFIWEITWHGPEEESVKKGEELAKMAEQVEKGIKNGTLKTKPFKL